MRSHAMLVKMLWQRYVAAVAVVGALCTDTTSAAFYETFSGRQISPAKFSEFQRLSLIPFCAIEVKECSPDEPRRLDYSCNNLHYPPRGATMTPYRRMLPPDFDPSYKHRPSSSGEPLPNARAVRTSIMSDGRVASKDYTQLVTNGLVFITGDVTSIHDTANYVAVTRTCCEPGGDADPRCMPIFVPEDDVHLRTSNIRCLNLTRAITYQTLGCLPETLPPERINTSPPLLELSVVYGNDEESSRRGREGKGGRVRVDVLNGREWPPSGSSLCLQNSPPAETRCHDTPVPASNIIMGANIMFIWLYREHNSLARRLEAMNPCWNDERLYREAREINIAYMNQIWYYELMPALMGYKYLLERGAIYETAGHINDYDEHLEPRLSIEYVTATRWFHTMQEGRTKTYSRRGELLDQLPAVELTLRTGMLPNNRSLEGMTQGVFRQPCAAADHLIDPDIGERILGSFQVAADVMSSDIMKNRDAGLPAYNKYRQVCGLPVARDFDDLLHWMPQEQVDALRQSYERVEDVDLLAGIMSEKTMRGAAVGPTLACIMTDQLLYWRRADRFWYENKQHPGAFTAEQLYHVRHLTLARLICDNGDDVDAVQPRPFLVPGPGNEIVDCRMHEAPQLDAWRDESCGDKQTPQINSYIKH